MKIIIYLLLSIKCCYGTTYYVKVAGGTGSGLDFANAWSYAYYNSIASTLAAGSGVNFLRGETYYGALNTQPGVSGNPTTYGTYGSGANPIISGFSTLTSWSLSSGHIYYATLSFSQVQNVVVDGVQKGMGRYPNTGWLVYDSHSGNTSITGTTIGALPASYVGGEVAIKKYRYIIDRHKITAQASNTITYDATNSYGQNTSYDPTDGNGYIIQNHVNTLDQDGEWAYDAGTSRLYMYFSGTPTGRTVKASTISTLATLNSSSYVTFNNIDFEGGITGIAGFGAANIIFNTCRMSLMGTGIYNADCSNWEINSCTINYCTTNGIFSEIGGQNTRVITSLVANCGLIEGMGESGDGKYNTISIAGDGTVVSGCTVQNSGFNGVAFIGDDILVENNRIDSTSKVKDDAAAIYTFTSPGVTASNRIIRGNIVTNCIGNPNGAQSNGDTLGEGAAIYLDGNSNHTEVYDNICAYGNWAGLFNNANPNNTWYRNTAYDFAFQMLVTCNGISPAYGSVRNLSIYENSFIARTASQLTLYVTMTVNDSPGNFGVFNSNYYARPISEGTTINFTDYLHVSTDMTLATWRGTYSLDQASLASQVTTTNPSDIRFDYNYTASPSTVSLGAINKDVSGTNYRGTMGLGAYGGRVTVFNAVLPVSSTKVAKSSISRVYVNSGKVSTITN
jgi:hypothetical protein